MEKRGIQEENWYQYSVSFIRTKRSLGHFQTEASGRVRGLAVEF